MNTIALCADYSYIDKIETTVKSIVSHNPHMEMHLINTDIPHEWFLNLNQFLKQFGSVIIDEKLDPGLLEDFKASFPYITNIAFGRFFIPDLIDADKVLYLDCDLVVDCDLDELFSIDLNNKLAYAVEDYAADEFNSGVMLINNKRWREENIREKLFNRGRKQELKNGDQTVINEVLGTENIGNLDLAYNYQIGFELLAVYSNNSRMLNYIKKVKNPKIIHYVTDNKPFKLLSSSSLREKWWYYHNLNWEKIVNKYTQFDQSKIKTPTFEGEAFLFTNVAETQDVEELIQKNPNIRFNIAAYTPMAWTLVHLSKYDNVHLYPSIVPSELNKIINSANIYLDINYDPKERPILEKIIDKNISIVSFEDTKTKDLNYQKYYTFDNGDIQSMGAKMQSLI